RFTLPTALNLALGIATVACHLHARGIMHGDLYAHNIQWNPQGDCLLGDFGAASFLPQDAQQAAALQRIEVRAYACLLEELLERCDAPPEAAHLVTALQDLQHHCDQAAVDERPLFADIRQQLAALQQGASRYGD
ncbi:MAG TPA: protein kinase, partial [Gallionella sp.]|nr:protein kinase [Gallionella sp.]